jgi:hypothetical protein
MNNCGTTTEASVLRHVGWTSVADASAPILRKAAHAALLQDHRLEIHFDDRRGEYHLGIAAGF